MFECFSITAFKSFYTAILFAFINYANEMCGLFFHHFIWKVGANFSHTFLWEFVFWIFLNFFWFKAQCYYVCYTIEPWGLALHCFNRKLKPIICILEILRFRVKIQYFRQFCYSPTCTSLILLHASLARDKLTIFLIIMHILQLCWLFSYLYYRVCTILMHLSPTIMMIGCRLHIPVKCSHQYLYSANHFLHVL